LRNRFYIGQVAFKGEILRGEQEPVLDRDLFEAVQAKLDEQANSQKRTRTRSEALLTGRIFDDAGNRMSPTHARKSGVKYRYYLSSALLSGAAERTGSVARVPAAEVETVVAKSVREHVRSQRAVDDRILIETARCSDRLQKRQRVFLQPCSSSPVSQPGEIRQRAGQAIDLVDDDHVDLA
jgi:site-specific DNA recombinase